MNKFYSAIGAIFASSLSWQMHGAEISSPNVVWNGAQDIRAPQSQNPHGFVYFRFSGTEFNLYHPTAPMAGFGIGYRRIVGDFATDISVNGSWYSDSQESQYAWSVPRISYLKLLQPAESKSWYIGAGLAWGELRSKAKLDPQKFPQYDEWDWEWEEKAVVSRFSGIIPSVTAGYQFSQEKAVLGFGEITVSQPALPIKREGSFPGPLVELSVGVGF